MGVRDRILELVFPGLKRERRDRREHLPERRRGRRSGAGETDGYDPRYFIRHQK